MNPTARGDHTEISQKKWRYALDKKENISYKGIDRIKMQGIKRLKAKKIWKNGQAPTDTKSDCVGKK